MVAGHQSQFPSGDAGLLANWLVSWGFFEDKHANECLLGMTIPGFRTLRPLLSSKELRELDCLSTVFSETFGFLRPL